MIVDCHVHLCPDSIAEKNLEIMTRSSGFKPACKGTVSDLLSEMQHARISISLVNNIVLVPRLVKKANDWTAKIASSNADRIRGIGWIHPLMDEPQKEVQRCFHEMGFAGIKLHFSNTKVLPFDSKALAIFEKCQELEVPILVHCGPNVENIMRPTDAPLAGVQYSRPSHFLKVMDQFPGLRMVLGHLAGAQHFLEEARTLLDKHSSLVVDTALGNQSVLSEILQRYGPRRVLFGTDYPVVQPTASISGIESMPVSQNEKHLILGQNAATFFGLS